MPLDLDTVADLLDLDLAPKGRRRRRRRVLTVRAGVDLLELARRGAEKAVRFFRDRAARGSAEDPRLEEALEREADARAARD